jgi:hypothetical protein
LIAAILPKSGCPRPSLGPCILPDPAGGLDSCAGELAGSWDRAGIAASKSKKVKRKNCFAHMVGSPS